jgi:hypothetical protein
MMKFSYTEEKLKFVLITLIPKPESDLNHLDPSLYRGISLLAIMSFKTLEKLIQDKINLTHNRFTYGFQKQNSCMDLWYCLKKTIEYSKAMYERNPTFVIQMADFEKCFNNIDMYLVADKLLKKGLDECIVCLIVSMFTGMRV